MARSRTVKPMPRLAALLCISLLTLVSLRGTPPAESPQAELQRAVDHSMANRSGTVVVLDVKAGRILAQHRLDVAARTLAHPGSTLKPFTLLALLESGKTEPSSSWVCPRKLVISGRRLDCTHVRTAEALDAITALAYSCNAYFTHFAERLTDRELSESLVRAGLSSPTGLTEPEVMGRIRPAANLDERRLQAVGEANVEITPLELLAAYRRLALQRRESATPAPALATVFAGLEGSTDYGMGRLAQPAEIEVAGKTGTASSSAGQWTHAWFVGYAPAKAPEIALVVFLERGRGGTSAASVAREIFAAYAHTRSRP